MVLYGYRPNTVRQGNLMNSDEDFLELPTEYDLAPAPKTVWRPPVAPPPPPVPVAALSYSMPLGQRRPGLVTAIGVVGIIVASISMLSSLSVGFFDFGCFALSAATSSMAAMPRATSTVNVAAMGTPATPTAPNYIPLNDDATKATARRPSAKRPKSSGRAFASSARRAGRPPRRGPS